MTLHPTRLGALIVIVAALGACDGGDHQTIDVFDAQPDPCSEVTFEPYDADLCPGLVGERCVIGKERCDGAEPSHPQSGDQVCECTASSFPDRPPRWQCRVVGCI